jgi:hypothetical protein
MNSLSNKSYTNKDFNSIYEELLECAKTLSYKWDPSASSESDPGVVLLKLLSIVADKNNYNIDKNVLELFPSSVTQTSAARQIFEQCGYNMKYHRSATTAVNFTIKKQIDEYSSYTDVKYTLPIFTMLTDVNSSVVYTTTEEAILELKKIRSIPVIEGTITDFTINDEKTITYEMLDSKNRLYFTDKDIAENGIFIKNVTSNEFWDKVDYLELESSGYRCFKFGVSLSDESCYIEFPEDIPELIGDGLTIKYIRTSGSRGNITAKTLTSLFSDVKVKVQYTDNGTRSSDNEATLTNDFVSVYNVFRTTDGVDAESIEDAYSNYKRVKNTFNTLVSLKDYTDYMISSGCASNGYVCDRTNDIQRSYKISKPKGSNNSANIVVNKIETVTDDGITTDSMTAFDLCVYALQNVDNVADESSYLNTFKLVDASPVAEHTYVKHLNEEEDLKCIQHDFKEFEDKKILMIKNKYRINATIIPIRKLSVTEQFEVKDSIRQSLYKSLNSNKMTFGEQVSYDVIYDSIVKADSRIRAASVEYPTYETYVVYKNDGKLEEMRVDFESNSGGFCEISLTEARTTATEKKDLYYLTSNGSIEKYNDSLINEKKRYFKFDPDKHSLWVKFIVEIFAKNVLCNTTPLYTKDDNFLHSIAQKETTIYEDVSTVTTKTEITPTSTDTKCEYEVRPNESIILTRPELTQENNYSSYVKVLYNVTAEEDKINANVTYELKNDDYLVFFWKKSDSSTSYSYRKYTQQSAAKYFSCNVNLNTKNNTPKEVDTKNWIGQLSVGEGEVGDSEFNNYIYTSIKSAQDSGNTKLNVLSGTNAITTYEPETININNKTNGCTHVYWILNNFITEGNEKKYPAILSKDMPEYILRSGEYFLYTNEDQTALKLLGEGTKLNLVGYGSLKPIKAITYNDILVNGIDILADKWFNIPLSDDNYISYTEMKRIQLGPQSELIVTFSNTTTRSTENNSENLYYQDSIISDYRKLYENVSSLKYIESSNGTEVTVDLVQSEKLAWQVRSLLNISGGPNNPQKLETGQSIIIGDDANKTISSGSYVLFDKDIQFLGGETIDLTSYVGGLLKTDKLKLLNYNLIDDSEVSDGKYKVLPEDFQVELSFNGSTTGTSNTITVSECSPSKGQYLLHVYTEDHSNIETLSVKVTKTTGTSKTKITKLFTNDNNKSFLWLLEVKDNDFNLEFTLTPKADKKETTLLIEPLFKFNKEIIKDFEELISKHSTTSSDADSFEYKLKTRIAELDSNFEASYTEVVNAEIENPLYSSSFFNRKHYYRPYTICQWNDDSIGGDGLNVTNNIK